MTILLSTIPFQLGHLPTQVIQLLREWTQHLHYLMLRLELLTILVALPFQQLGSSCGCGQLLAEIAVVRSWLVCGTPYSEKKASTQTYDGDQDAQHNRS